MANYALTNQTAASAEDASVEWRATTATAAVSPTWSSINRAQVLTYNPRNFGGDDIGIQLRQELLSTAARGFLHGRRPVYGMKYPRGYYGY